MTEFERGEHAAAVDRLRAAVAGDALRTAWETGRRMTADAAVALALSP